MVVKRRGGGKSRVWGGREEVIWGDRNLVGWVHQRWSLATLLLLGFCSGSGYSVDASQTQTHTHTKHMAAVSHAHARSCFVHTYKSFLQKQKCHQNIVSQCMLIPMKCTHTRIVCLRVQTTRWPLLSWGRVSASAFRPPWTSPASPP